MNTMDTMDSLVRSAVNVVCGLVYGTLIVCALVLLSWTMKPALLPHPKPFNEVTRDH